MAMTDYPKTLCMCIKIKNGMHGAVYTILHLARIKQSKSPPVSLYKFIIINNDKDQKSYK